MRRNMSMDDGGPAFPVPDSMPGDGQGGHGMTLRDWFAGQALAGSIANGIGIGDEDPITLKDFAEDAYRYADAMLKVRDE